MENRINKVKDRGIYLNPFIGDLARDMVEGVYKCRYWDRLNDNYQLQAYLRSWTDWVLENWSDLEHGHYKAIRSRPVINHKTLLSQNTFISNIPDVEKD